MHTYHICSNGHCDYNCCQIWKDGVSIRGRLPFEVCTHTHYCPHIIIVRAWQAKWMEGSVSTALCVGTMSTRLWTPQKAQEIVGHIPCNLQLKCGVKCSLLLYHGSGHSQSFALCLSLHLQSLSPCPLTILNVTQYDVYFESGYYSSLLSAASIRGRPLNRVQRLLEQI